jgi:hypothetical protein
MSNVPNSHLQIAKYVSEKAKYARERDSIIPRNGCELIVGVVARISGGPRQKEASLENQIDHANEVVAEYYAGPVELRIVATKGKGENLERPELVVIEQQLRTRELDLLICEDIGRVVRGHEACRLCGIAVDHGTRVLAPNDGVDTNDDESDEDYSLVVGLRNSHDHSFSASIAMGSAVFVCDNLAFSGEVAIARKHTRFIRRDLPRVVHAAVGRLADMRVQQHERITAYKRKQVSDSLAHDLVVRAIDASILPVTQVPTVLSEWRTPAHEEFAADGKTVWRLFNAFTETLKGRNLVALPSRSQALHGLIDGICGLAV